MLFGDLLQEQGEPTRWGYAQCLLAAESFGSGGDAKGNNANDSQVWIF